MGANSKISWFPGHMRQAFNNLQRVLKGVDLIIEARDARVPFSSANPHLSGVFKQKRHLVVLTKTDLVPTTQQKAAASALEQQGLKVLSASCATGAGVKQVMASALDWLKRERAASDLSIMMVVGLPNSAKSSLINAFKVASKKQGLLAGDQAYQKRARVGATPGLTRQVAGFQVSAEPCVYMLDTPGISIPNIPSHEAGMRLALAGAIKDAIVGEEAIASFMLQLLSRDPASSVRAIKASGLATGPLTGSKHTGFKGADAEVERMRACLCQVLHQEGRSAELELSQAQDLGMSMPVAGVQQGVVLTPAAGVGDRTVLDKEGVFVAGTGLPPWLETPSGVAVDDGEGQDQQQEQLEALLHCLGVAEARNPSARQGALIRLLRAFREGRLGKFCFDPV